MWCKKMIWLFGGALALTLMVGPLQGQLEFGIPTPVPPPFNLDGGYGYPTLSNDGLHMFFVSDRPFYGGDYTTGWFDIWTSHRASLSDPWESPVNFGAPINTRTLRFSGRRELTFHQNTPGYAAPLQPCVLARPRELT